MRRHALTFVIGTALIVVGNLAVLAGVAYNRSGEPEAVMLLSERELRQPYYNRNNRDNSGLALRLSWRAEEGVRGPIASWLDRDKLRELGFDVDLRTDEDGRYRQAFPREAWIVLEFDGPAHRAAIERWETELAEARTRQAENPDDAQREIALHNAERQLEEERERNSRLFAVDAGLDRHTLRQRYADRARYLILPGRVDMYHLMGKPMGSVAGLDAGTLNVALEHRDAIVPEGKYAVTVAFGKRGEGWIVDAQGTGM